MRGSSPILTSIPRSIAGDVVALAHRVALVILALTSSCSDHRDAAPLPPPATPVPACTRTIKLGKVLASKPGESLPESAFAVAFAMLDEHALAVLYYEGATVARLDGTPRGPDDRLGVALYDLRHAYQHDYGAETHPGWPEDYVPYGAYPVEATQMALRTGSQTLLLAGPAGVASLDVRSGCLHELALGPRHDPEAMQLPFTLTAFDRAHGRIFAVTETSLVGIDDTMTIRAQVPAPTEDIRAIGYDDATDRVI